MRISPLIFAFACLLIAGSSLEAADGQPLALPWFEIRPGIVKPGDTVKITAWVENVSASAVESVTARLALPEGTTLVGDDSAGRELALRPKEAKRVTWEVKANTTGVLAFSVEAAVGGLNVQRSQTLAVVAERDLKREYQSNTGAWFAFPERPTLQEGNAQAVTQFESLPSSALKRNNFGITAHLPRGKNDEDPFIAKNAVDGDPDTCWGCRWWRTNIPFEPEWIEIDLGAERNAAEIRFLPGWKNSGVPLAFRILASLDGAKWDAVADETDYQPKKAPPGDKLLHGELTWQCFPFDRRPIRYVRFEATRLGRGPTSFFCCPGDPAQFRVAEVAVLDKDEKNFVTPDCQAKASSEHTAWYNSPATIEKTWPLMLRSGVKVNRVGQWGDKLDWARVERVKGVYEIDPDVDRSITESVGAGIDILLTLDYGNNLYQRLTDPQDFGKSTWFLSHPFLQCAPTTPEAVEGFAKYCAFMAKHFKGRVKYFEIWNEENGWFFDAWSKSGTVSMAKAYGKALAAAAKAIKEANPDAVVVFGGIANASLDYPRIAMEQGAGPYIDIYAFHPYDQPVPEEAPANYWTQEGDWFPQKPRPAEIKNYEDQINAFKEIFRKYNPNIKIWADEWNYFAPGEPVEAKSSTFMFPDQSELSQAKFLARFYALSAALDSGAVWWSFYNANHVQEWAVIRSADCTPRAAYYSAGYVATVLDDCTGADEPKIRIAGDADPNLMLKPYRNGRGDLLVGLWRKTVPDDACKPAPVTLELPTAANAEIVDTLYGFKQKAVTQPVESGTRIPNLLVGDWPLILRIEKSN